MILIAFLVRLNLYFFDMTAVLICVQNELVCVCHLCADSQL